MLTIVVNDLGVCYAGCAKAAERIDVLFGVETPPCKTFLFSVSFSDLILYLFLLDL